MNIRKIMIGVTIVLIISSTGVWGARLIKSQTQPQTSQQTTQTKNAVLPQPPMSGTSNQGAVNQPVISPMPSQGMPATPTYQSRMTKARRQTTKPVIEDSASMKPEKSEGKGGKQYVTMDFDGVDIKVFVKFIADITGKNFILDDKVSGKVTVISPRKMSLDEAYQVFLSVLDVNGFGTVNMGGVIKVVQAADAVTKSIGTSTTPPRRREDVLVTQIIPLKHADVSDMKTLFQPLLTKGSAQLMAYPQSNILIITDTKSNIKKMMEILKIIDVTGFSEDFKIFSLTHASASDLSTKLSDILSDDKSGAGQIQRMRSIGQRGNMLSERGKARIIPYERTNSIIVMAASADMERIGSLIKKLDIATPTGKEDIHVYYLQYARAEDTVKVLTDLPTPAKADSSANAPVATDPMTQRGLRNSANSDKIKISADKETNSLIIYADPDAYQSILGTIKYLDIPRKQVYVKAVIMEVSQNKDLNVGVEWNFFEDFAYDSQTNSSGERVRRQGGVFGRTGNSFITSPTDIGSGAAFGIVGEAITIGSGSSAITFPNLTSFIRAMATDTDVKILSTPQIITMDNKEAEIRVGSNVPYLTREQSDSTNLNNTVRTFDYRDVGVTLRLTPQINQQGNIRLELFEENTSLVEGTGDQQYAPTTLKRSAKTTVTVKDGTNIVIGGLIGDTVTFGESGVPLLRSIPILGHLFKSNSRKIEKTNLYVFLSPKIIDSDEKASDLYKEKYGELDRMSNKDKKKDKAK